MIEHFLVDIRHFLTDRSTFFSTAQKYSIERYLQERGYQYNLNERCFSKTKEAFKAKLIESKKMGLGRKAKAAEPITAHDETKLIKSQMLSDKSPWALQFSLFYFFTKGFGMRGRDEHRQLK